MTTPIRNLNKMRNVISKLNFKELQCLHGHATGIQNILNQAKQEQKLRQYKNNHKHRKSHSVIA